MSLIWTAILLACTPVACRPVALGHLDSRSSCLLVAGWAAKEWLRDNPGRPLRRLRCVEGEETA